MSILFKISKLVAFI